MVIRLAICYTAMFWHRIHVYIIVNLHIPCNALYLWVAPSSRWTVKTVGPTCSYFHGLGFLYSITRQNSFPQNVLCTALFDEYQKDPGREITPGYSGCTKLYQVMSFMTLIFLLWKLAITFVCTRSIIPTNNAPIGHFENNSIKHIKSVNIESITRAQWDICAA